MQEGTKEAEPSQGDEKSESIQDLERSLSRSSSQRMSIRKSTSNESSRHSFSITYGVPGFLDIREGQQATDDVDEADEHVLRKRSKVSIKRLAYLNKPEVPYLLIGTLGAGVQGLIFPVFGLLLSTAIKIFFEPPNQLRKDSRFWGLMMVVLALTTLVALPVQNFFFGIAGGRLIQRIRYLSFKKVVHQEISWFDDPANSRLILHPSFLVLLVCGCLFDGQQPEVGGV